MALREQACLNRSANDQFRFVRLTKFLAEALDVSPTCLCLSSDDYAKAES